MRSMTPRSALPRRTSSRVLTVTFGKMRRGARSSATEDMRISNRWNKRSRAFCGPARSTAGYASSCAEGVRLPGHFNRNAMEMGEPRHGRFAFLSVLAQASAGLAASLGQVFAPGATPQTDRGLSYSARTGNSRDRGMAALLTLQLNMAIRLQIVAPVTRHQKVFPEARFCSRAGSPLAAQVLPMSFLLPLDDGLWRLLPR